MSDKINLTVAAEVDIEVVQGDKLDMNNATITIVDHLGDPVDMTLYANVELNIYRDEEFQSRIYQFTNPDSMTLGIGYFILLADPFPLSEGRHRYGLREMDGPGTLATGYFIINRKY